MKHLLFFLALLMTAPAWSKPLVLPANNPARTQTITIQFLIADTADSEAIAVSGFCSVRYQQASGDDVSLYSISASATAASSGTLLRAFTASTTTPYEFRPGTFWVKAKATDATAGGSILEIECSPAMGGGGDGDADNDGLYEVAYLWDADGDGSAFETCTANATPDIACKAVGERVYRDVVDDVNCAVHDCGFGAMESDGTLILAEGVYVGWACWDAANPSVNSNATMETNGNDDQHDSIVGDAAAYADCALDDDGAALTSIALQDWQGTLTGSGVDTRKLERGSMSASLRRDRGTYLVNDMGPWNDTSDDNVWFGNSDNQRFLNAGFHTIGGADYHNGAGAGDGDSKGWGKTYLDGDLDIYIASDSAICLRNSNGSVGVDYSASGWVANLRMGDTILVPVKTNTNATAYHFQEVRVRETPSAACGTSNYGLRVALGGSIARNTAQTNTYPANAGTVLLASGQIAMHARSNFRNTRATITNMTISPSDPWNEFGGRCTSSGTAWRTLVTDSGTGFTLATDDTNTDFSCDTMSLIGFYGGGSILLTDVAITEYHHFAIDGGSGGGIHVADNVKFYYGNGGPIADTGNGWEFKNILISDSHFTADVISVFGPTLEVDNFEVRNSVFTSLANFSMNNEGTLWKNTRVSSSSFGMIFWFQCGARWNTIQDVHITGRAVYINTSTPFPIYFDCDSTTNPITQNVVENVVEDSPGASIGGASPVEQGPIVAFNAAAAANASYEEFQSIRGNKFSGIHSVGYLANTTDYSGCLFGAVEMDADSPPDDDGESSVFTFNYHEGSSIVSYGRVFCMTNSGPRVTAIDSEGAATPAWGDPVGCGNFDGTAVFADENCG